MFAFLLSALIACGEAPGTPDGSDGTETTAASTEGHDAHAKADHEEKAEGHSEHAEHAEKAASERGAEVFATNCASCHGATGKGDGAASAALDPKPADLSVSRSGPHASGKNRWQIILTGSEGTAMPGWEKILSTEDLDALHIHIGSLLTDGATCGCGEHHDEGATCGGGEGHGAGAGDGHGAGHGADADGEKTCGCGKTHGEGETCGGGEGHGGGGGGGGGGEGHGGGEGRGGHKGH